MALEQVYGVAFVLIGLSHALQPRLWTQFFISLVKTGYAGFVIALYTLPQGLILVLFHNEWSWSPGVIVTVAGWGMTIKSVSYLIAPCLADRIISPHTARYRKFTAVGVAMTVMGAVLCIHSFAPRPV